MTRNAAGVGLFLALIIPATLPALAQVQGFPTRPIRFIVPFAAAGTTDIVARLVSAKLAEALKQQLIVDNRGGAGSTIGTALAAAATPDGYTLLLGNNGLAINATLYPKLPYGAQKDLAPISLVGVTPNVLVVTPALPARSVREFIALAKAQPGNLAYASAGVGSSTHLSVVLLEILADARFTHVPYKGGGPALTDAISGQVQFMLATMPSAHSYIMAGRLRALAVTGSKRSQALPEVPTVAASGLPGYEYTSWYGILVPAGTPKGIIARLNETTKWALGTPDLIEKLKQQGLEPEPTSPEKFGDLIRKETAQWAKVIRSAGLKVE